MSDAREEAERAAFESHEALSWAKDPVARDAAIRWHMRGFEAGAEWQASRPVTEADCICESYSQDAGGGYFELLVEYDPACPVHSTHLFDPIKRIWVLRAPAVTEAEVEAGARIIAPRAWALPHLPETHREDARKESMITARAALEAARKVGTGVAGPVGSGEEARRDTAMSGKRPGRQRGTVHPPSSPARHHPLGIGPDCNEGKHRVCDGRGFDLVADQVIDCACGCHTRVAHS